MNTVTVYEKHLKNFYEKLKKGSSSYSPRINTFPGRQNHINEFFKKFVSNSLFKKDRKQSISL